MKVITHLCILIGFFAAVSPVGAEMILFDVKPMKCVSLNQGNVCYQTIRVQWQSISTGDYCLQLSPSEQPLTCWQNVRSGQYKFEFAGRETLALQLVDQQSADVLKSVNIEVKWVYKSRFKSNLWRVF